MQEICDTDKEGGWLAMHVLLIRFKEFRFEESILKMAWERFDEILGIRSGEECLKTGQMVSASHQVIRMLFQTQGNEHFQCKTEQMGTVSYTEPE